MTSKMGFSGEYVRSLSPADRKMYIHYYMEEQKQKKKSEEPSNNMNVLPPIDTLGDM